LCIILIMNRLGYCCICLGINIGIKKKNRILINRGMTKKTFDTKGLSYVSELSLLNILDLKKILEYNILNNIHVYRMSSDMFPCIGFYNLKDLPNFDLISTELRNIGDFIKSNDIRTSFHPSHFNVLASENPSVVLKTIDELNKHAEIMDLMGLNQSTYYPINIHINTTQPTREGAANRFCNGFKLLSDSAKKRLVVENDDKISQYSVKMLYDLIYLKIGIPITFDQLHFRLGTQDQNMEEALKLALSTWKVKPLTHMASSIKNENINGLERAHADYIYESIERFGLEFDTEIESKAKDLSLIKYRMEF